MAEEPKPNPENQGPKDERDLIIEDLKARMEKIESDYQIKIGDYQKANAELWARLHPAQEPAPPAQIRRRNLHRLHSPSPSRIRMRSCSILSTVPSE